VPERTLEVLTMIQANSIKFHVPRTAPRPLVVFCAFFILIGGASGQATNKNSPYSPSPEGKIKEKQPQAEPANSSPIQAAFIMQGQDTGTRPSVAQRTFKIAKDAEVRSMPPSEIYKVGVGDVLLVNLKNSAQGSRYCTVQPDGTIDFPLAGENLIVADQTVDDIEEMLASGVTLFSEPQIEVKVREYASHKISVAGMVENPGEKSLQREAIPLFVIRSEAVVSPTATRVFIRRSPLAKSESYDLRAADTDDVLIYPGNAVEFTGDSNSPPPESYYIAGEVNSAGQKEMTSGLTLYQAVIASGGAKGEPKRATIRRKNDKGVFENTEYDLRSIRNGNTVDPVLTAGDVIEIRK